MRKVLLTLLVVAVSSPLLAANFMTQQQALASAFPPGTNVQRQTIFLSKPQISAINSTSGTTLKDELVVRYVGRDASGITGYAYFDTHIVRTLPETVMFVVTPAGTIARTEILSFNEPTDYLPKRRWLDQLLGKKLNNDLSLRGAVRPISGASLSGVAIVNASRRILAIHQSIESAPAATPRGVTGAR